MESKTKERRREEKNCVLYNSKRNERRTAGNEINEQIMSTFKRDEIISKCALGQHLKFSFFHFVFEYAAKTKTFFFMKIHMHE